MSLRDRFEGHDTTLPLTGGQVVTPDDDNDLDQITRAIYIGTGGDLAVVFKDGTSLTILNLGTGWHPLRLTRIKATGTTADDIFAGW